MDWPDWPVVILSVIGIVLVNQPLASWLYHRRIKKSRAQFLADAQLKFPNATIMLRTVAASDLEALQTIQERLNELPDGLQAQDE